MEKEQIINTISDFIREILRKKDLLIHPEDNFFQKLGLDSMAAVEFIIKLEEEFGISIDDTEAQAVETPNRAAELILEKLSDNQNTMLSEKIAV